MLLPPTPSHQAIAETLLADWEIRTHPDQSATSYPTARQHFGQQLAALLTHCATVADVNVDFEDIRSVLAQATARAVGSATAHSPQRAADAAAQVLAAAASHRLGPAAAQVPTQALLSLNSGPTHDLEMDELTRIVETIQTALHPDVEMIFGHGTHEKLGTGLQAWLLLGYAAHPRLAPAAADRHLAASNSAAPASPAQ